MDSRRRNTTLFVAVSLVSGFGGTAMSLVAGVWVMSLTGSAELAGLAELCVFLPTLGGPLLGAMVDKLPRRGLLVGANLGGAVLLLCLLAVRGPDEVWLLYAVMVGYGVKYVLIDAGEAAVLPAALPEEALGSVNGLRMSAQEGTKLVAPLAGAGLFAWAGGYAVAALTAGLLATAAGLYALIRTVEAPRTGERARIRDGIGYLWRHRSLRTTVLIGAVCVFLSGVCTAVTFALIDEGLHRPATFVGVLASLQGAGSIVGGVLAGRVPRLASWGAVLFAIGTAARCVPWLPAVIASGLIVGVGLPWTVIAAMTAVQRETPPELLGRVAGTATTLTFAPVAVAIPLGTGLLALTGYQVPQLAAAAVALAIGIPGLVGRSGLLGRSGLIGIPGLPRYHARRYIERARSRVERAPD